MPVAQPATLDLGASYSRRHLCRGCGAALLVGKPRRGRQPIYCVRCRDLRRIATRLKQGRDIADAIGEEVLVLAIDRLLERTIE